MTSFDNWFLQPSDSPVRFGALTFRRNHPKVCPSCGRTFYAYIPDGEVWEPHKVDPEPGPRDMVQQRETCHDAQCLVMEQQHQFRRKVARREVMK